MVIEAVFEDINIKHKVIKEVEAVSIIFFLNHVIYTWFVSICSTNCNFEL